MFSSFFSKKVFPNTITPMVSKFYKSERVTSPKVITALFSEGNSFNTFPIRIIWVQNEYKFEHFTPIQVLISVPKKSFPLAVDRNLIKRRIKESWRLQKKEIYSFLVDNSIEKQFAICLLYNAKEIREYDEINNAISKMIPKWTKNLVT